MRKAIHPALWALLFLGLATGVGCERGDPDPPGSGGIGAPGRKGTACYSMAVDKPDRMILRTASLTLQVDDVAATEAALRKLAEASGGFVVDSSQVCGEDRDGPQVHITFRVPSDRFDDTLTSVEKLARRVLYRSVRGEDVTEDFVDLDARRRNLAASRARLLVLLEKAGDVAGAVEANKALTEVQGELERVEGRMKYLERSASLSSVSVELTQVTSRIPEAGWHPLRAGKAAFHALVGFAKTLANTAIALAIWSPVWLGFFLLVRTLWRRLTRPKPPETA